MAEATDSKHSDAAGGVLSKHISWCMHKEFVDYLIRFQPGCQKLQTVVIRAFIRLLMIPQRRKFLQGVGWIAIGAFAGCVGVLEEYTNSDSEPSVEEVKANSETIPYDELYRNIDEYEGEYVYYSDARISDIIEGEGAKEYLISLPGGGFSDSHILYGLWDGNPFRDGDDVEIWGVVKGLETYNSLVGEQTVPKIDIVDMVLLDRS